MYLIVVEHTKIPDPSDTQIVAVLEDLAEDGNLFSILAIDDQTYIQAALSVFMPVAYRIASGLSLEGDHVEDVALLAILFLAVTVFVFSIVGALVKWFGIRCFARRRETVQPHP